MWRKALQISKRRSVFSILLAGAAVLFAQSLEMPTMPEMPAMPSISPSGSFYRPSVPNQKSSETKSTTTTKDSAKTETVITDANNPLSLYSALLNDSSTLTAYDISSLYDSGLFTDISSLSGATSLSNYATTSTTNILLQQVLNNLNDLKTEQNKASPGEKTELEDVQTDSKTFKTREPSILRFRINGYNIADSLTTIFFSDTEPDGTFLLTADRRYFSNSQVLTETFYMLFRATSSSGSTIQYKVQPSIVQTVENKNSYVYKLAEIKNLTAEKTGNLVVLHYNEDKFTADMLLDIDRK